MADSTSPPASRADNFLPLFNNRSRTIRFHLPLLFAGGDRQNLFVTHSTVVWQLQPVVCL